jgi:hypothetical protein
MFDWVKDCDCIHPVTVTKIFVHFQGKDLVCNLCGKEYRFLRPLPAALSSQERLSDDSLRNGG